MKRWIIIGAVLPIAYRVVQNSGFCCAGYWINWRGRVDWAQPHEFSDWEELEQAVRRRLELAGLQWVDAVMDWAGQFKLLRVLVSRKEEKP